MKFKLSEQEQKDFEKVITKHTKFINDKRITDQHWELFWTWIRTGDFPVMTNMEELVSDYFNELLSPEPLKLSNYEFLSQLSELYSEHRSDVTEMVEHHLKGNLPRDWKTWRERRFITFMIPTGTMVVGDELKCEYDTLTGSLEVVTCLNDKQEEQWEILDGLEYRD